MCVEVSYEIGIEREFLDREVSAVCRNFRVPADESRTVGIEETIGSSYVDSPVSECRKKAVADAVFVIIERV